MSIRDQILDECREIFEAELALIRKYDDMTREVMPSGIPEAMIIAEFDPNTRSLNKIRRGKNSSEIIRAWIYREGKLEPYELTKEPRRPQKGTVKNEFYRESYARFAYSEEQKVLYLNIFYSPEYVKGWRYPVINDDGRPVLGESCLKWLY